MKIYKEWRVNQCGTQELLKNCGKEQYCKNCARSITVFIFGDKDCSLARIKLLAEILKGDFPSLQDEEIRVRKVVESDVGAKFFTFVDAKVEGGVAPPDYIFVDNESAGNETWI